MSEQLAINLLVGEVSYLIRNRHVVVTCDCGNHVFVWPNRNRCACHRARCLRCKNDKSYTLDWRGKNLQQLVVYRDTYGDYLTALDSGSCDVAGINFTAFDKLEVT